MEKMVIFWGPIPDDYNKRNEIDTNHLYKYPELDIVSKEPMHPDRILPRIEEIIDLNKKGKHTVSIITYSEIVIDAIRFFMATKKINAEKIEVKIIISEDGKHRQNVYLNGYGSPDDWPEGFCDTSHKITNRMMNITIKRYEKER
jgi:predicted ATPase